MIEDKISLYGLGKYKFEFEDTSDRAANTFNVYDMPETFYLGKNQFKISVNKEYLVDGSKIFIDIVDSRGNAIFYKVSNLITPDRMRTIIVHVYDTTPLGECTVLIAGRLGVNPLSKQSIPFSNSPSSNIFKDIPNVIWRHRVNVSLTENVTDVIFDTLPVITYSEKRIPVYTDQNLNRSVSLYPTASGKIFMQSQPNSYENVDVSNDRVNDGTVVNKLPVPGVNGGLTFDTVGRSAASNPHSTIYSKGFEFSASMEGGQITVSNIQYEFPNDAASTGSFPRVDYSGSILKVVSDNLIQVYPPLYRTIKYKNASGGETQMVVNKFKNHSNFTASFFKSPSFTSSSNYQSYLNLQILNAEPEYGSVKKLNISYKEIGTAGQNLDLGNYPVLSTNVLKDGDKYEPDGKTGIRNLDIGVFNDPQKANTYWTASSNFDYDVTFGSRTSPYIKDGISILLDSIVDVPEHYYNIRLENTLPTVYKNVEYEFEFDLYFPMQDVYSYAVHPQVDVYISGSATVDTYDVNKRATLSKVDGIRGTYMGSVDINQGVLQRGKFNFKVAKGGDITPVFIIRSIGIDLGNISIKPRNLPGYSANLIETLVSLPDVNSSNEIMLNVGFLNSKNHPSDYSARLFGITFQGNTVTTGSGGGTVIPSGTVSGSDQLTSSFDPRYERRGTGIISSSQQLAPDISGSFAIVSSSLSRRIYSLELTSGSLNAYTGSSNSRLSALELNTGSMNSFSSSVNSRLAAQELRTGSYATTGSNIFRASQVITGSLIVSLSVSASSFTGVFNGAPSSSAQIKSLLPPGTPSGSDQFSSSYDGRYERRGTNILSSSAQIIYGSISGIPTNVFTSSQQVSYTLLSNVPSNIVSASQQLSSSYDVKYEVRGNNIASSSAQIKNFLPAGTVSSSQQINSGSFSGSFFGDGNQITGIVSSSYSLTSSYALIPSGTYGEFTGTTDGSGFLTIPHQLGFTPTIAVANVVSTVDSYLCTVRTKAATTFQLVIRRSTTGAAVASTSVTVNWICR